MTPDDSSPYFLPRLTARVVKGFEYWVCHDLGDVGMDELESR